MAPAGKCLFSCGLCLLDPAPAPEPEAEPAAGR
jgi:hypothetical protein